MSDRTGRAVGSLEPIIYFERDDGYCVLPCYDAGCPEQAREVFDRRFKNNLEEKWRWRETGTQLRDIDEFQKRLVEQETRRNEVQLHNHGIMRDAIRKSVRDSLYSKMVSSSTSPFEREAIGYYLDMRDDVTRDKWRTQIEASQCYLWAREQDSNSKVEDRMVSEPGDFWRNEQQQKS